jgi:hypothetical protein
MWTMMAVMAGHLCTVQHGVAWPRQCSSSWTHQTHSPASMQQMVCEAGHPYTVQHIGATLGWCNSCWVCQEFSTAS